VFSPPSGFAFEPEFLLPPPRQIPENLERGPHALGQRRAAVAFVTAGFLCLVVRELPVAASLALYILPLGYLGWIGLGCLLVAAVLRLQEALHQGPYRYVRDGLVVPARVVQLVKAPSVIHNGQPAEYAFTARVELVHPETGALVTADVKSKDFSAGSRDRYDTPFGVGDYATAVYLPGRLEKTIQLYAFLDLSPDVNLRSAQAPPPDPPWKVALAVVAIGAIFTVLFSNLIANGRYQPIDFEFSRAVLPMSLGALFIGGALLAAIYASHQREQKKIADRARETIHTGRAVELGAPFLGEGVMGWVLKVAMGAGSLLLGALTALCWCLMANALLDTSQPRLVPATVTGMKMTTHALIFREYELEYRLEGSRKAESLLTTPWHLGRLAGADAVVAHVREGRLGWPWVQTVEPATLATR
jgi:hypothetical protein